MFKKLFMLATLSIASFGLSAIGSGLRAQVPGTQSSIVYQGANNAKTVIVRSSTPGFPQFISHDNHYISGIFGGAAGFAYDLQKDTTYLFGQFTLPGFVSLNHYVGSNDPGENVSDAFTFYNGQKFPLEKIQNSGKPTFDNLYVEAVQSNGDKIVTMGYKKYTHNDKDFQANIPAVHNGKTGKLICELQPVWPYPVSGTALGFGARGDCISADGTVVGGHSTYPFARRNWSLAFWDISDPNNIQAYGIEEDGFDFGTINGVNSNGSVMVGNAEPKGAGVIIYYNRADKSFTHKEVYPLPGWDFVNFTDISDDSVMVGYCGMSGDPGTREAIVYTPATGLLKLNEFLYEYYNINVGNLKLHTPMKISRDGLIFMGFCYNDDGDPSPWCTFLSAERILPRARKVSGRAIKDRIEVVLTWQKPFVHTLTLKGYNIYRDDATTPLNANLLQPDATTFTDNAELGLSGGRHTYYVEAVYEDGTSTKTAMKSSSNMVQVVETGECFPVQTIGHRLEYNRYATLYWGRPSSEVAALAKNETAAWRKNVKGRFESVGAETTAAPLINAPKSYINPTLDYIANVDMLTYSGFAGIRIGDLYYTSSHTGGGIKVIDRFNEVVKDIKPEGLGAVMSMVYIEDENKLYCGTLNAIKVIDLARPNEIEDTYPVPARYLAHIPAEDGGKGVFLAGKEHTCYLYRLTENGEQKIDSNLFDFKDLYVCGAAYYKGKLYVSSATGPYYNEIYVYDYASRKLIGEPLQMPEDPALYNLLTFDGLLTSLSGVTMAGGLSICPLEDGTTALGAVFQCAYMTTRLMLLELESDQSVKGYDLYRRVNGATAEKLNTAPLTSRRYKENLSQSGQYAYYVTVLSEVSGVPATAPSPIDTLNISPALPCPRPAINIKESNRKPILSWMPDASPVALVGFNLYRNQEAIGRFWSDNGSFRLSYIDEDVTELGTYNYRLEVLYDDGCLSDSTTSITLTGVGTAMPPYGLALEAKKQNNATDVKATWESPMFEEPMALRYGSGMPNGAVGFTNYYECWAAVGWDTTNLKPYKDLYLVGMEYFIGALPQIFEGFVILNNKMVHTQKISRPMAGQWQTVMFDQSFSMNQPGEVVIGYHTKYTAESQGLLVVDVNFVKTGYSDLVTLDGKTWSTLKAGGQKGSWCIAALVVHKRNLDEAKRADGSIDFSRLSGSVMRMALGEPLPASVQALPLGVAATTSTKDGLNLVGYNLYRRNDTDGGEDVKLNAELLKTCEFTDVDVPSGEWVYTAGAVYADGQELKTDKYIELMPITACEDPALALSLRLYPNPASEVVNVEGAFETLQIMDINGREVRREAGIDGGATNGSKGGTTQIRLGRLKTGAYLFRFTGEGGREATYKVVVR